jgi:hypothetical protein
VRCCGGLGVNIKKINVMRLENQNNQIRTEVRRVKHLIVEELRKYPSIQKFCLICGNEHPFTEEGHAFCENCGTDRWLVPIGSRQLFEPYMDMIRSIKRELM